MITTVHMFQLAKAGLPSEAYWAKEGPASDESTIALGEGGSLLGEGGKCGLSSQNPNLSEPFRSIPNLSEPIFFPRTTRLRLLDRFPTAGLLYSNLISTSGSGLETLVRVRGLPSKHDLR